MAAHLHTGVGAPGVVEKRTFLDLADAAGESRLRRANSDSMLCLARQADSELEDKVADSDAETVVGEARQEDSTSNSERSCRSHSRSPSSVSGASAGGLEEQLAQAVLEHGRLARENQELWQHMEGDYGHGDGVQLVAMDQSGGWWQMPNGQACYLVPVDAASFGMGEQCYQSCAGDEARRPRGRRARAARAAARRAATAAQERQDLCEEVTEPTLVDFPASHYDAVPGAILPVPVKQRRPVPGRTTVMLRNMPNNYNRSMLLELLDLEGFAKQYDFLYLPIDFKSRASLGYAFINLQDEATALRFFQTFDGYSNWIIPSRKVSGVSWAGPHQGLRANVERYRNSPVMARSVPDEYKPVVFEDGIRAAFPVPTRRIRAQA